METQTAELVSFLGQSGVTGLVAVLCIAIVLMYRNQNAQNKDIRETVEKYARDLATCQQQTLDALQHSTETIATALSQLSECQSTTKQALEKSTECLSDVKSFLMKIS